MKLNKLYRKARKVCGEYLGTLTTDEIYSKLSLFDLEKAQMWGFEGITYEVYFNAWTPGMSRVEANRKSGLFTHVYGFGACVPTAVSIDDDPETLEPCSGDAQDGFYLITKGEYPIEHYINLAQAKEDEESEVQS